jgi:uncharacterized membrane protein
MNIDINTETKAKKINTDTKVKKIIVTARQQAFENSILRQFSQFERVQMKTTTTDEMKMINSATVLAVHRADSALDRRRDRRRERARVDSSSNRKRDSDKEFDRLSDRERRDRDREQAAMSKET